jgi:hydroxymethylpyrimidine pyrophosphatase-like HAD family hydrolase
MHESMDINNFYTLKISNINSDKYQLLNTLVPNLKDKTLIVAGGEDSDSQLFDFASYSICLANSSEIIKEKASKIIPSDNPDDIIKYLKKIYYGKIKI